MSPRLIPPNAPKDHVRAAFAPDDEWPNALRDALAAYRTAWRAKMDEVNETIAASAPQEELVDQPEVEKGITPRYAHLAKPIVRF